VGVIQEHWTFFTGTVLFINNETSVTINSAALQKSADRTRRTPIYTVEPATDQVDQGALWLGYRPTVSPLLQRSALPLRGSVRTNMRNKILSFLVQRNYMMKSSQWSAPWRGPWRAPCAMRPHSFSVISTRLPHYKRRDSFRISHWQCNLHRQSLNSRFSLNKLTIDSRLSPSRRLNVECATLFITGWTRRAIRERVSVAMQPDDVQYAELQLLSVIRNAFFDEWRTQ